MKPWKFWSPTESGAVGGIITGLIVCGTCQLFGVPTNAMLGIAVLVTAVLLLIDHYRYEW